MYVYTDSYTLTNLLPVPLMQQCLHLHSQRSNYNKVQCNDYLWVLKADALHKWSMSDNSRTLHKAQCQCSSLGTAIQNVHKSWKVDHNAQTRHSCWTMNSWICHLFTLRVIHNIYMWSESFAKTLQTTVHLSFNSHHQKQSESSSVSHNQKQSESSLVSSF